MAASGDLLARLSTVARALQNETGAQNTLDRAVSAVTGIVKGVDLAGVSIANRHGIATHAASDESVLTLDRLQTEVGEGPTLDALRDRETVYSADLRAEPRWPSWGPRVVDELGVRSVLSFRLFTSRDTLGALNLFSRTVDAFDDDDVDNALALASHVSMAIAADLNDEQLQVAVTSRTVIGQAQGILMERFGLTADRAFEVLVRLSSHQNVKLHQVARELVATRKVPRADARADRT